MMRSCTKRQLDAAVSELKRDGYSVLILMLDKGKDESQPLGSAMEVMCSETNDPQVLASMARHALAEISRPISLPETLN